MMGGTLISLDEITNVSIDYWKGYYDEDGDLIADSDDGDYVVIYDWDYTKEHYAVCVLYERGGQEKRIAVDIDCRNGWINELLSLW